MSTDTPSNVPAGWYPDPYGAPVHRWWDGTTWSQTTQPAPQAYAAAPQYAAPVPVVREAPGVNPITPQVWILALTPLLGFITTGVRAAMGGYSASYLLNNVGGFSGADLVGYGISVVFWLGMVALAFVDYRSLVARQLPRPFHWAWGFLPFVYIIGRSVVAYSRTGRGLGPMFVWIGAVLFNWIVGSAIAFALAMMMF